MILTSEILTLDSIDLNELLKSGLTIVGGRGIAKTSIAKHLIRRFMKEKASNKKLRTALRCLVFE